MINLRIATRKSPLALWQTYHVRDALQRLHPTITIEIIEMTTQGDKILETSLALIGGKGLFVKELEQGLLKKQADIAVHSMKDVPVDLPAGLILPVIMQREAPFDAFVSIRYKRLTDLPQNAVVGTTSLRRQSQLLALRPDLRISPLRGNVGTRLRKLETGEFDAIILAVAGLRRLKMEKYLQEILSPEQLLPAIGQGAIGIECRADDLQVQQWIAPLKDSITQQCVQAERAINRCLSGGCHVPIAGFAEVTAQELRIRGLVGEIQGKQILRSEARGTITQAEQLGETVAQDLLAKGADSILAPNSLN